MTWLQERCRSRQSLWTVSNRELKTRITYLKICVVRVSPISLSDCAGARVGYSLVSFKLIRMFMRIVNASSLNYC